MLLFHTCLLHTTATSLHCIQHVCSSVSAVTCSFLFRRFEDNNHNRTIPIHLPLLPSASCLLSQPCRMRIFFLSSTVLSHSSAGRTYTSLRRSYAVLYFAAPGQPGADALYSNCSSNCTRLATALCHNLLACFLLRLRCLICCFTAWSRGQSVPV